MLGIRSYFNGEPASLSKKHSERFKPEYFATGAGGFLDLNQGFTSCENQGKNGKMKIQTKRVYEPPARTDGQRFLVERLWPRGVRKEALRLDGWQKEAAPSHALRKWFNHDPARWTEFQRRYRAELDGKPGAVAPLLAAAGQGPLTLLFSARDVEHNSAVVLQAWLEERAKKGTNSRSRAVDAHKSASLDNGKQL